MLPLAGYTVVSLEQAVAAPFATRQLADLGARVIKIERPGGGDFARHYDRRVAGNASYFVWLNRSKESLTLDLKQREAAEILERLLAGADVFLHNLSPGAVDRLGFGAGALRERHPALVICEISGYGRSGPLADRKAYDLLIQAESGFMSVTGTPDTPVKAGISIADISAGMYAFSNVLAALLARRQTGAGHAFEVPMLESLGEWLSHPFYYAHYGGEPPQRTGARHATIAPYGPFACGDGEQVLIGIQNDREWRRFCERILGDAALADDARFAANADRVAHREALEAIIAEAFAAFSAERAEELLDAEQIAYARMRDMAGFAGHPQLAARERWSEVAVPGGATVSALLPPGRDADDSRMDPVPAAGEHSGAILAELGYDAEAIEALRAREVTG